MKKSSEFHNKLYNKKQKWSNTITISQGPHAISKVAVKNKCNQLINVSDDIPSQKDHQQIGVRNNEGKKLKIGGTDICFLSENGHKCNNSMCRKTHSIITCL